MSNNDLRNQIVNWLRDYLDKSGKDGFVVGMSGGIDSSVIALMGQEAAKASNKGILAMLLPIKINRVDYYDEKLASHIVKRFAIPYKRIDLTSTYESLASTLGEKGSPVSHTNLKARLRLAAIYFYANSSNYLVLGTVNKGEFHIGYFPKNASAGDVLPLADVLKKEIRTIGKSYDLSSSIIERKASGCVWAQTAEEEWGFTEDELDSMVEMLETSGEEEVLKRFDAAKGSEFLRRHQESKHKRRFYPMYERKIL